MDDSFLREIEETVNSLSLKWYNKFSGMIKTVNRLPDLFSEFEWNQWDERDYNLYGESMKFSFELFGFVDDTEVSCFTRVKVIPVNDNFNFIIRYGEQEKVINSYNFIIKNENDYTLFLHELLSIIIDTYVMAEKSFKKIG